MNRLVSALILVLACTPWAEASCVVQTSGELTAQLTWTNTDTVTTDSVNILRSTSAGTETVLITVPYGTTYTDTVPAPTGTISYFYEVQAKGPGGISSGSNEVCKTFFVGPPAPTGLTVK